MEWSDVTYVSRSTGKARRLKQAKEEAQAEIETYRQEREKQFKEFESKVKLIVTRSNCGNSNVFLSLCRFQHLGSRDDVAAKIDTDMRMKMEVINACMTKNKEEVILQIMKYIYEIKPAIHKNIRVE